MKEHLAFMVFCIERDLLDHPVSQAEEKFQVFIKQGTTKMHMTKEAFCSVMIWDAKQQIKLGNSYGMYDNQIKYFEP